MEDLVDDQDSQCTGGDVRKVSLDDHLETSLGRRWCDPPWMVVVGDNNATLCALQL